MSEQNNLIRSLRAKDVQLAKVNTESHLETNPDMVLLKAAVLLCGIAVLTTFPSTGLAGSARDYLNAPIDSWLTFYNVGYFTSVTPEDGMDETPSIRANVLSQSVVVTRTMDYWGRTGGISVILPYTYLEASSNAFQASNQGLSDIGFLWQMNIFGGPALTKEQFRSFVPQTYASFHFFVGTPLGTYDAENTLNPSSNRWTFFPTINYSYTPDQGWTWLDRREAGSNKLGKFRRRGDRVSGRPGPYCFAIFSL